MISTFNPCRLIGFKQAVTAPGLIVNQDRWQHRRLVDALGGGESGPALAIAVLRGAHMEEVVSWGHESDVVDRRPTVLVEPTRRRSPFRFEAGWYRVRDSNP